MKRLELKVRTSEWGGGTKVWKYDLKDGVYYYNEEGEFYEFLTTDGVVVFDKHIVLNFEITVLEKPCQCPHGHIDHVASELLIAPKEVFVGGEKAGIRVEEDKVVFYGNIEVRPPSDLCKKSE